MAPEMGTALVGVRAVERGEGNGAEEGIVELGKG